jgi:hypothetical protein
LLFPAVAFYLYGPRGAAAEAPGRQRYGRLHLLPRTRYPLRGDAAWLMLIPAGLGAWLLASQLMLGDALASWHSEAFFGRGFAGPLSSVWGGFGEAGHPVSALVAGHPTIAGLRKVGLLATALAALAVTVGVFRRLPLAYGVYALIALCAIFSAPQSGHPLASQPRYILVVFPLFMWLGWRIKDRRAMALITTAFALGLIYCSAMFATWHFVA